MKTRKDAERVVELSDKREELHKLAGKIRMAEAIAACDPAEVNTGHRFLTGPGKLLEFAHLTDELRTLIKREAEQQIAAIDKELETLGVVPDEFEAAAPKAGAVKLAIRQNA